MNTLLDAPVALVMFVIVNPVVIYAILIISWMFSTGWWL